MSAAETNVNCLAGMTCPACETTGLALVAEVRRLRAIEDAARAWAAVTMYVAEGAHSYADAAGARRDLIAALEAERRG